MNHKIDSLLARIFHRFSPSFVQPIFIVSAPRSGSSFLYEAFQEIPGLCCFEKENDPMWWRFYPYSRLDVPHDYIAKEEVDERRNSELKLHLLKHIIKTQERSELIQHHLLLQKPLRYVEKTIANCFHLEAIEVLFPDALFIHIVRDGRACISSMIEGWNSGFFWQRPLPFRDQASINYWTYPIPPGWQKVEDKTIEEICAWSWIEHNRYIVERCNQSESFRRRYIRVSYEKLIENPMQVMSDLLQFSGLDISQDCMDYLSQRNTSWTTISAPKSGKWKEENFNRISNILPTISPVMQELGYLV